MPPIWSVLSSGRPAPGRWSCGQQYSAGKISARRALEINGTRKAHRSQRGTAAFAHHDLQVARVDPIVVGDDRCRQLNILEADRFERAVQLLGGQVQTAKRVLLELVERFSELVACFLHLAPQTRRKAASLTLCSSGENLLTTFRLQS